MLDFVLLVSDFFERSVGLAQQVSGFVVLFDLLAELHLALMLSAFSHVGPESGLVFLKALVNQLILFLLEQPVQLTHFGIKTCYMGSELLFFGGLLQ